MYRTFKSIWFTALVLTIHLPMTSFAAEPPGVIGKSSTFLLEETIRLGAISWTGVRSNPVFKKVGQAIFSVAIEAAYSNDGHQWKPLPKGFNPSRQIMKPKPADYYRQHPNHEFESTPFPNPFENDFILGLRIHYRQFSLNDCGRSILLRYGKTNAERPADLPATSFFIRLPGF